MKRIELGLRMIALALVLALVVMNLPTKADDLTDQVNAARAQYGLPNLVHDDSLCRWAAENNRYGFGHHVLGSALRQNAAWGIHDVRSVVHAWLASPGHRAAILAIDVNCCGGHYNGSVWTLNFGVSQATPQVVTPVSPALQKALDDQYTGKTVTSTPQASSKATPQALPPASVPVTKKCGFHPFRRLFCR